MGCPKLNITDFFCFAETEKIIHHEVTDLCFAEQKINYDNESELVYYNYRYYSPELSRWLSRDPIGEYGGVNLYAMVGNDPVNWWDWLGFKKCTFDKNIKDSGWLYYFEPYGAGKPLIETGGQLEASGITVVYKREIVDQYICKCCFPPRDTTKTRTRIYKRYKNAVLDGGLLLTTGLPGPIGIHASNIADLVAELVGRLMPTGGGYYPTGDAAAKWAKDVAVKNTPSDLKFVPESDTGIPTIFCLY